MNHFTYDEADGKVFVSVEGHLDFIATFRDITSIEEDDTIPNRWLLKSNMHTVGTLWDCERTEEEGEHAD